MAPKHSKLKATAAPTSPRGAGNKRKAPVAAAKQPAARQKGSVYTPCKCAFCGKLSNHKDGSGQIDPPSGRF